MDHQNFTDRLALTDEITDAAAVVRQLFIVVPIWLIVVYVWRIGSFSAAAQRIEDSMDGTVVDAETGKMIEHVPLATERQIFRTDAVHFRQNLLLTGLSRRRTALKRCRVKACLDVQTFKTRPHG